MALYPAPDMSEGVVALWIAGDQRGAACPGAGGRARLSGGARVNARFEPADPLRGRLRVPADKSISHRAAILAAMASEPVADPQLPAGRRHPLDARRRARARRDRPGARADELVIRGVGLRHAQLPAGRIDVGNAGTLMRLLPGWLAVQQGTAFKLDGDDSIRRRPVDRIAEPLELMGARIEARDGRFPPFTVHGAPLEGIEYPLPVASAQVKSCVLLAGLVTDRHDGDRADPDPRPHRADAAPRRARRSSAEGDPRQPATGHASATPTSWSSRSSTCRAISPRPRS